MPLLFSNTTFTKDGYTLDGLTSVTANIEVRLPASGFDVITGFQPDVKNLDDFYNLEFELTKINPNVLSITVQEIYEEIISQLETRNPTWTGKISIV